MILANEADRVLVRRLLQGDEAAFTAFFDTYFDRLYRFALRRLNGDREATRDVTQQTMIRALDKIHTWRGEAQLFTWLCTLCRREAADLVRREARHTGNVTLFEDTAEVRGALESVIDSDVSDPLHQSSRAQIVDRLQVALDRLPSRYGDALEWKYVYGYSTAEIASRLGVGREAAQSLLARARRAFHDLWLDMEHAIDPDSTARAGGAT